MALATLTVDLILKAGGFESDMGRASRTAQKRMKEIEANAKRMGIAISAALAAGITAVGLAVKGAIDRADELYNTAQKIGVTTESLSGLEFAAKQAGVELEDLQGALGKMVKVQAAAAKGNEDATALYKAFGVELKDTNGHLRDSQALLLDWAAVFADLPDGAEKTALAMEVFGKSGANLIPFLNEGRTGIADLTAEAERLGIVISTETGRQADELNDKVDEMKAAFNGAALELAVQMMPKLIELTEWLKSSATEGGTLSTVVRGIGTAVGWAGDLISGTVSIVEDLSTAFAASVTQLGNFMALAESARNFDFEGIAAAREKILRDHDTALDMVGKNDGGSLNGAAAAILGIPVGGAPKGKSASADQGESDAARAMREYLAARESANAADKAAADSRRAAAEATREQAERERDLAEAVRKVTEASAEFHLQAEDRAAQLAGPMAEAALQYQRDLAALRNLAADGEVGTSELTKAEADLEAQYRKTTEAIEERLNPGRQVLADLQFQIDLLGMATQAERDYAIFKRDNANATDEQAEAYARMQGQFDETRDAIAAADEFRNQWSDAFASILDGTKSIGDAFDDLASDILASAARALADKFVQQLFGDFGTLLGSSGGGFEGLGSFFGSAKGNVIDRGVAVTAFERGGLVNSPTVFPMARGMGLMGEAGPEAILPLARDAQGRLGVRGGGMQQVNNFLLQGRPEQKTQDQMAQRAGRSARRAMARFD